MGPLGLDSQMIRLAAFRRAHPEWKVYMGEFGEWHAERDTGDGSDTHVRFQLSALLDLLEDIGP